MTLIVRSPLNDRLAPHSDEDRPTSSAPPILRSRVFLPACVIVVAAMGLIVVGWATHWGGASLASSMTGLRIVILGPATLAILLLLLVAERVWPAQNRPRFARGHRHDVLYTILNMTLTVPFVAVLSLSFADVVRARLPGLTFPRVGALPHGLAVAAIFVAMDGCNWLAHVANHRVQMLWRFHELHHSQEDMNVLTVFRTHPFVHFVYLIALLPGIVLLANGALPTALLVVYAGWVALAHSNIRLGFGPLGRVFVSPNYHRIHHRLEGRQDVNLGFALTIWDQLFRTAIFPTPETVGIVTGLKGRPLIVEQSTARPRHLRVFFSQLIAPFRPVSESQVPLPSWTSSSHDAP
jgi:sterol desaturase/sphingolipid hydroxylase (fatty acid hydroxylase superfamily)